MNNPTSTQATRSGFTLVEMMVASFLSLLLMLGVMSSFVQQRRTFALKTLEHDLQQNLRSAVGQLKRDLSLCGSGVVMGKAAISQWFPTLEGATGLPHVSVDAQNRDQLTLLGYPGAPVGTLRSMILSGETFLDLDANPDLFLPYTPRVGDVLVLGSLEAVKVTSVNGNRIGFTSDPTRSSVGVHLSYPAGMDIYELTPVTYRLSDVNGSTGLARVDARFTYSGEEDQLIAMHIESFTVEQQGDTVSIELTGKTKVPLAGYQKENDEFPRLTLSLDHVDRNLTPDLAIRFWDPDTLLNTSE